MKQPKDKVCTIRLNQDEWSMLDEMSKNLNANKSTVVRTAILNLWKKK